MTHVSFPPLALDRWQSTRDTIHGYARLLGAIRRAQTPPLKHWWHISLRAAACGLTTTPMPAGELTFEMLLDLATHELTISTNEGDWWDMSVRGQSFRDFSEEVLAALETLGIEVEIDRSPFSANQRRAYDEMAVEDYWLALSQIDILLKQFRGELREETSPVQLWPHHFDLALAWFSGNRVPDADPNNPEYADEQMAFGFSTGDEGIPNPYFYITAYPWRDELLQTALPAPATWHTAGWKGALLPYNHVVESNDPRDLLLTFWRTTQKAGAALMKGVALR